MSPEAVSPEDRLRVTCPNCGKHYKVKPHLVGKTGPCKFCGEKFTIAPDATAADAQPGQETPREISSSTGVSGRAALVPSGALSFGCPKCGKAQTAPAAMVGRDLFCTECGVKLTLLGAGKTRLADDQIPAEDSGEVACPKCGAGNPFLPEYVNLPINCAKCGAKFVVPRGGKPILARAAQEEPAMPETPAGKVFASKTYGYSFALSTQGWYRYSQGDERAVEADLLVGHNDIGTIRCVVSPTDRSTDDFYAVMEENYATEVEKFKCFAKGKTTIAGIPAAWIRYAGIWPGGERTRFLSLVFVKDQTLFQLIAAGPPETFDRLKQEAAEAARTFSFDPARLKLAAEHQTPFLASNLAAILLPKATFVFVPAMFVVGLVMWLNTRQDSSHYGAFERWVLYLWWMIYPLIGYYWSLGWEAAAHPGCCELRYYLTELSVHVSNAVITLEFWFFGFIFSMFGGSGAMNLCVGLGKLFRNMAEAAIRIGSRVFGRLADAWWIALPQTLWQFIGGGRPVKLGGSIVQHVLGAIPALVLLGIFAAPFAAYTEYQSRLNYEQWQQRMRQPQSTAARTAAPQQEPSKPQPATVQAPSPPVVAPAPAPAPVVEYVPRSSGAVTEVSSGKVRTDLGRRDNIAVGAVLTAMLKADPIVFEGKTLGYEVTELRVDELSEDGSLTSPVNAADTLPAPGDVVQIESVGAR